jgi:hypothetical protein
MKSLKEYIDEGLLDRVKNKEVGHKGLIEEFKGLIEEFLKENYKIYGAYTIKETNNKFVVDVKGRVVVKNKDITSLTNGIFEFGSAGSDFYCSWCAKLTTLEGAPQKVGGNFCCNDCKSLKSLEGAPKEVGGVFNCSYCKSLRTLEGAPQKVGMSFNCSECGAQFTEEYVKKYTIAKKIIV